MDSAYYLSLFLDEGRDKLHHVGQLLGELEHEPGDMEKLAHVFREIHSFKGNADTMGFVDMTALAHAMEHVLDGLRTGALAGEAGLMRLLGRALVTLELRVADVEAGREGEVPPGLVAELTAIGAAYERPADEAPMPIAFMPELAAMPAGARSFRVTVTLDPGCFIKGPRAFIATAALEALGAVRDVTPSLEELDWPDAGDSFAVTLQTDADADAIRGALADVGEIRAVAVQALEPPAPPEPPRPLPLTEAQRATLQRHLDAGRAAHVVTVAFMPNCRMPGVRAMLVLQALGALGEAIVSAPPPGDEPGADADGVFQVLIASDADPAALADALTPMAEVRTAAVAPWREALTAAAVVPAAEAAAEAAAEQEEGESPRRTRTLRVDTGRYDEILALAETLSEANARLARLSHLHGDKTLDAAAQDAAELAGRLHDAIAALGRVPIETVFNRFPRMVRELAHELGKQVSLQVLGSEVELERALADELSDVLVHLLRNAVDHGLETPAERHAAGKGAVGTLQLAARQDVGFLWITVADDGRGVDPRAIAASAVRRGRLTAAEAEHLAPERLIDLIFDPGFSTAAALTRISGRGVGLDAVKRKAEDLGGRLTVESATGRGTIFQLRFPLRDCPQPSPARR